MSNIKEQKFHKIKKSNIGGAITGMLILAAIIFSSFAAMLAVMARIDPDESARAKYLKAAKTAFAYSKKHKGVTNSQGFYESSWWNGIWEDGPFLAALELYRTTKEETYKTEAKNFYDKIDFGKNSFSRFSYPDASPLSDLLGEFVFAQTDAKALFGLVISACGIACAPYAVIADDLHRAGLFTAGAVVCRDHGKRLGLALSLEIVSSEFILHFRHLPSSYIILYTGGDVKKMSEKAPASGLCSFIRIVKNRWLFLCIISIVIEMLIMYN